MAPTSKKPRTSQRSVTPQKTSGELRAAVQELRRSATFLQKTAMQFGGKRDLYKAAGYPRDLVFADYWSRYRRGDIAARLIDMPPQATWRTPPEVWEGSGERLESERTPFETEFQALAQRLKLWARFEKTDRLAGVGRYAVLLLGVADDDANLSEPLPELGGASDVLFVSTFREDHAKINKWINDPSDPRFGLPLEYEIDLAGGVPGFTAKKERVHWSRLIHVAEDALLDEVFGRPQMERMWNRLMDLDKIAAATGEAYWQLASRILTGTTSPDTELSPADEDKLLGQLEEVVHDLRRVVVGQNMDFKWLESQPPNPKEVADMYFTLIAASRGIPKRMLFGSETGERASEQDARTWAGTINERQERHAEPNILRAFIDRLIAHKGLPAPSGGYTVIWPTLLEESEGQIAEANKLRAEAAKALTPIGGDPRELVEVDKDRNVWLRPLQEFTAPDVPPRDDSLPE